MFFKQICRCSLGLCFLGLSLLLTSAYASTDKIVAVVNDDVITQSEVQQAIDEQKKQMTQANITLPSEQEFRRKVLDALIERTLVLQIAKRNNFKINDKEVDAAIEDVAKRNNVTVATLQQELQKAGISFKDYRKKMAEEITVHRIQQQAVGSKITVTDQDIANYMRKAKTSSAAASASARMYHIVDILLPIQDSAKAENKKEAQKIAAGIIARLKKGEEPSQIKVDGAELTFSDLGVRRISDLPDIFVSSVTNLKKGEVASPIVAPNGLHLIKVLEITNIPGAAKQPGSGFTVEDARQMAMQHKFEEVLKPWMEQLRSTAYIKIND